MTNGKKSVLANSGVINDRVRRFDDWDSAPPSDADTATGSDAATSPRSKFFLNSPLYSLDNYRQLAFIKNTFAIIHFFNIIWAGLGCFIIYAFTSHYFRWGWRSWRLESEDFLVILSVFSVFLLVFQYLPKRRYTLFVLSLSTIVFAVNSLATLWFYIIIVRRYYISAEVIIVIALFLNVIIAIFLFLVRRASVCKKYFAELRTAGINSSQEELLRNLSIIITDSLWSFWRLNPAITPGSLADRLEDNLLLQLRDKGVASEAAITAMKQPAFQERIPYILKYPRFFAIDALLAFSFYIAASIALVLFFNLPSRYSKIAENASMTGRRYDLADPWILIILALIATLFLAYIGIQILKRRTSAGIQVYRFGSWLGWALIVFINAASHYLTVRYEGFNYAFTYSLSIYYLFSVPVIGLLPVALTSRFVRHSPAAFKAIHDAGVGPRYSDFIFVRDAYLIITGFQRNVENADEDGWE